jgi:hypothetical protein
MTRFFLLLTAVTPALFAASADAQTIPIAAPVDGLLLLKNGETLPGTISRSGDFYLVATRESEIQIRIYDAEAVCRNLDEAYRFKFAKINQHSADDRLALAQWCLDRKLYGLAARELTEAYKIDDLHPRVKLMERRLKAELAEPKPTPQPATPVAAAGLSEEELEKIARSISAESLHDFTTRIQPLLVNYCATAGCHGPKAASSFQLHRVYLNERNDPRLVRLNLHAVLAQIDKKNLPASRLLTVPLSPHGGAKKPLFHTHNAEHYHTLAGWTARAVGPASAMPSTARAVTMPGAAGGALLQRLPIAPPTNIADSPVVAPPPSSNDKTPPQPQSPPAERSEDPFDPAAFNRRREAEPKATP